MKKRRALGWFWFGLGGDLQLVASLSITELFIFVAAPLLFFKEQSYMKRNGIMPFFYLSLALVLGCVIACLENHTPGEFALRGMAVCCLMPCAIIVTHWMLRNDMSGLKWFFVGGALSGVLCTFVFQKAVEVSMMGSTAEEIMGGATYWIHRLGPFITMPSKGWYLSCPILYSIGAPLFLAVFSMLTSISGRGAAVRAIASAALVLIGGKKRSSIRSHVCRHFWIIVLVGFLGAFAVKQTYQIAATSGWLGEKALDKYEEQTKGKTGFMALLLGGRMQSFCGLLACIDKPLVGFGPWAQDEVGYQAKFLLKYGDAEDYDNYMRLHAINNSLGYVRARNLIPCHSVVTQLWLWCGISGLLFCLYIFYALLRYMREDCWAVPQWYFWIGASVPGLFWDMCFNPLEGRVALPMIVVACLIVRAVRKGQMVLPEIMYEEILKSEH